METIYRYSHEIWPSTPVWLPELENLFDACDEIEYDKLLAALWRVLQQWWSESSDVKYQSPAYRDSFGSAEGEWRDVKIEREDA